MSLSLSVVLWNSEEMKLRAVGVKVVSHRLRPHYLNRSLQRSGVDDDPLLVGESVSQLLVTITVSEVSVLEVSSEGW
jgi:hypothetical protein